MTIDMTKIKKSESCPCGSGKLYRSCCFNAKDKELIREDLKENSKYIENFMRNRMNNTKIECCLYPNKEECQGIIKRAHTLQNNGILSRLSENGHVMVNEAKSDAYGIKIEFVPKGRNEATTFTGFCHKHDTELFVDIETKEYEQLPKQNFLFAYRAFSQEYHKKLKAFDNFRGIFRDKPSLIKEVDLVVQYRYRQLEMFDMEEYKKIFDNILLSQDYSRLNSIIIKLDKVYDFAVTTMFTPTRDLNGKELNDAYSEEEERQKSCFITIFPSNNETIIILSWLNDDDDLLKEFANQVRNLGEDELKIYLNNILPMYTENIILNPKLWNKMPNYSKRKLIEVLQAEFPRLDEAIDFSKVMESRYRYKDNFLEKPEYDLFRL